LVIEVFLLGIMFAVYELGRHLVDAEVGEATAHARHVWDVERWLRMPSETTLQSWVLEQADVAKLCNLYYVGVHFPATFAVLAWLFVRHREQYLRVRTELIIATAIALLIHINYPLAPPRLVSGFGIVDTMVTVGPSAYPQSTTSGFANQFAAMPSLHVGWAVLMAVAVVRVYGGKWRWAALLYPAATWSVVVITGNHYILDGAIGTLIMLLAVAACGLVPRWRTATAPTPAAVPVTIPVSPAPTGGPLAATLSRTLGSQPRPRAHQDSELQDAR
jgi:hypothetical protein